MAARIDPRPIWRILLERSGRWAALLVAAALLSGGVLTEPPDGLSSAGWRALAIFGACVVLWLTSALPYSITGLLAFLLLSGLGVVEGDVYRLFGSEVVFFILGAFMLAAAIVRSGLSARIAYAFLEFFEASPRRLVVGVLVTNAIFSLAMSEHGVAAFFYPVAVAIASTLALPRPAPGAPRGLGAALFLAMAWGCTIGGVGTFLGGGRNVLAVGIYAGQFPGRPAISFVDWMVGALPVVVPLLVVAAWVLTRLFRIEGEVAPVRSFIAERRRALGRVKWREKSIGTVFAATVVAWVFAPRLGLSLADIALLGVAVLFVLGLVKWEEIERETEWEILFMYAGAIGLGGALARTGAAAFLAERFLPWEALPPIAVLAAAAATSLALTAFISNAAAVAVLLPVALPIAVEAGADPRGVVLAVALAAGLDFTLPIGTPAIAIAYASGYLRVREVLLPGLLMAAASLLVIVLNAWFWWRPLGWL